MDALYDALLDAGDRLVRAVADGDLGAAAGALDERGALLARLQAGAARPSAAAVERFREQDGALSAALRDRLYASADAAAAVGRVSRATRGYAVGAPRPALLDTVPR